VLAWLDYLQLIQNISVQESNISFARKKKNFTKIFKLIKYLQVSHHVLQYTVSIYQVLQVPVNNIN